MIILWLSIYLALKAKVGRAITLLGAIQKEVINQSKKPIKKISNRLRAVTFGIKKLKEQKKLGSNSEKPNIGQFNSTSIVLFKSLRNCKRRNKGNLT